MADVFFLCYRLLSSFLRSCTYLDLKLNSFSQNYVLIYR